jgi:hypothetical protein
MVLRSEVMALDLVDVDFWHPGVGIWAGDQHVFSVDVVRSEVDLFEVLHAP